MFFNRQKDRGKRVFDVESTEPIKFSVCDLKEGQQGLVHVHAWKIDPTGKVSIHKDEPVFPYELPAPDYLTRIQKKKGKLICNYDGVVAALDSVIFSASSPLDFFYVTTLNGDRRPSAEFLDVKDKEQRSFKELFDRAHKRTR